MFSKDLAEAVSNFTLHLQLKLEPIEKEAAFSDSL